MNVYPIWNLDFDEQNLAGGLACDKLGESETDMSGYITEDGFAFYCEETPSFHPKTGVPLKFTDLTLDEIHEARMKYLDTPEEDEDD